MCLKKITSTPFHFKNIYLKPTILLLLFAFNPVFSQFQQHLKTEYFTNFTSAEAGIVFTDNYASSLYLLSANKVERLFSSPGCGMYYTISPDKNYIAFKHINNDGLQSPALFEIRKKELKILHAPQKLCGQPSIANNQTIAYTINEEIVVEKDATEILRMNLNEHIDITPVSPDGKWIAYCNINGSLFLINISEKSIATISEKQAPLIYPQWSADSKKILLQSGENIMIYHLQKQKFYSVAQGNAPRWAEDSEMICFVKNKIENFQIQSSDIWITDSKGVSEKNITQTNDIFEISPFFYHNNELAFTCLQNNDIASIKINNENTTAPKMMLNKRQPKINISYYSIKERDSKDIVMVPGVVPYIHQAYDTPNGHYGYGSCAPTTCIMALAYYNILPPWKATVDKGIGNHISMYGNYVSEKYRYREYYYNTGATTNGGDVAYGGYGFMWNTTSPNFTQKNFIQKHGVVSNQLWAYACTFTDTKNQIDQGYVHPICSFLGSSGHLTLTIGYVIGQHTLIFNDPYGNKNMPGYPNYYGQGAYYDWPGYNNGYQNLDPNGAYGYVAWTTRAQYTETTYNNLIIDDIYYNHGFYINNSENNSHQRYYIDALSGYNNHFWYTITMNSNEDICHVSWTPTITETGMYDVKAFIPAAHANAQNAMYRVQHKYGTSNIYKNQGNYNGQWIHLGRYYGSQTDTCKVFLGDNTGIANQEIAFDAVKWEKAGSQNLVAAFHVSTNKKSYNSSITFHNSSIGATNYQWFFEGGTPANSIETHPQITYPTPGFYDVKLIANNDITDDTIWLPDFIEIDSGENMISQPSDTRIFDIFPNPNNGKFNLSIQKEETGICAANLYDLQGKKVAHLFTINKHKYSITKHIQTQDLKGVFILEVSIGEKCYTTKLIIE